MCFIQNPFLTNVSFPVPVFTRSLHYNDLVLEAGNFLGAPSLEIL